MTSVNTNIVSLNAQRNLMASQSSLATSMQRLSSGLRVNSAKDDAAGLAIAERMSAQSRGMTVASRNANDGISLSQTAEGALGKVSDMLQRMRELAVQSSNATNNTSDRTSLNAEYGQLQSEIGRVLGGTTFNGTSLFDSGTAFTFQVGAGTTANDTVDITRNAMTGGTAGTSGGLVAGTDTAADILATVSDSTASEIGTSAATATNAIKDIDVALDAVNSERANYGAAQNRFDSIISNLSISNENTQAARSRIMDADFASETSNLSRAQILQQAGNAMVAQANQLPNGVMALLRG